MLYIRSILNNFVRVDKNRNTMLQEALCMPAVFVGHGSPMLALEDDEVTRGLAALGQKIISDFGKPRAILMVSAHWYTRGNLVQKTEAPKQVFDMYGFPQRLYEVKYSPAGCAALSDALLGIDGLDAAIDNSWGIDHGAWTPLVHVFPKADVPVVQLSVNASLSPQACFQIGTLLEPLRHAGFLVMGSGNIVHNLRRVNWESQHGSPEALAFEQFVTDAVQAADYPSLFAYQNHPHARYAVPTNDHFLPLFYVWGAAEGEHVTVFNRICNLDSMSMTGFAFGMD